MSRISREEYLRRVMDSLRARGATTADVAPYRAELVEIHRAELAAMVLRGDAAQQETTNND